MMTMESETEPKDKVFVMPWTPAKMAAAYAYFQIKDEWSVCPCGRRTPRVFDGECHSCHVRRFKRLGRTPCPPLPTH